MPKSAPGPVPEGMRTITPYLSYHGNCAEAIEFYASAFGSQRVGEISQTPAGRIMHAMIRIGNSNIMMSDSFQETDIVGNTVTMWVYVEDCDALYDRAIKAGCTVTMPMDDAFWGDRVGEVVDPYGYRWSIASWKYDIDPQEMEERQKQWLETAGI